MLINADRLRQGHAEKIQLEVAADFLDADDFSSPVLIEGEALMVEEELILKLHVKTKARLNCSICNQPVELDIDIPDLTHSVFSTELESSHYDYAPIVREEVLLQLPSFAECNSGSCPERETITPYLKKPTAPRYPFADL